MKFSLCASLCAVSLLSLIGAASISKADSQTYCTAYARDLANRKITPPSSAESAVVNPAGELITATASAPEPSEEPKLERLWSRAYKNALKSCLDQYSGDEVKAEAVAPRQTIPAVKPVAKKVEKQASTGDDGPKRGSEKWKKECLAKHPSFNAETGTYRTWSGAQRECRL